jgi:hypothetical protein
MEGWIMGDIRTSALGGIPFGVDSGRPSNPQSGQPYFNGLRERLEIFNGSNWQDVVGTTPAIATVTPLTSVVSGTAITINGSGFLTGATVKFKGSDNLERAAGSVTITSESQLVASTPVLPSIHEPYSIIVQNTNGKFGTISSILDAGSVPSWVTGSGNLGSFVKNSPVSVSVSGSDPDSTSVLYSSSDLPAWLSINSSTGAITGTSPTVSTSTTYSFNITISSQGDSVSRAFSLTVVPDLYLFTSHEFTTAGQTGHTGPTLSQVRASYSTAWDDTYLNMSTQGIQEWTVPTTANYYIDAYGAGGGGVSGGTGARIADTFSLTAGEVVRIVVGQYGNGGTTSQAAGGGGGTFVVKSGGNTNTQILVVAGGGGASEGDSSGRTIGNASTGTSGVDGYNGSGTTLNINGGGTGGINGNGGNSAQNDNCGAGGGGFFTNGQDSPTWGNIGGKAFVNGALGGTPSAVGNYGGFGGGGEGQHQTGGGGAGAGGGYSGGGGGDNAGGSQGGGGGSYYANGLNINRVLSSTGTLRNTHGKVIITKL